MVEHICKTSQMHKIGRTRTRDLWVGGWRHGLTDVRRDRGRNERTDAPTDIQGYKRTDGKTFIRTYIHTDGQIPCY